MKLRLFLSLLWFCIGLCVVATAAEGRRGRDKGGGNQPAQDSACLNVPAHPFDVILGRPTRDSVTASVLARRSSLATPTGACPA